jgi:hypothetical protein
LLKLLLLLCNYLLWLFCWRFVMMLWAHPTLASNRRLVRQVPLLLLLLLLCCSLFAVPCPLDEARQQLVLVHRPGSLAKLAVRVCFS